MPSQRKWMLIAVAALAFNLGLATAVIAGHRFGDVPNTNIFHNDITWLADNDITRGCNPPTNTQFCPKDNVTREQMAAFIRRFAGAFGAVEDTQTDSVTVTEGNTRELLSVHITPKSEAQVVLNTHVVISNSGSTIDPYQITIRRTSCSGSVVAMADWNPGQSAVSRETISLTGLDTVAEPTTYKVCAHSYPFSATATVFRRTVTAFWVPAG
jgi:hypothetical protein